jgi:PAS domain S-box-containing protein
MTETNLQPLPPCEAARLAALRSLEVLDTAAEGPFDELTALAASICRTPIALVSLVDECRQWFKSRVGWAATATPRDVSFCAHTILRRDLLIVPDASADARFADNPLVTSDPGIRFYAGAPLLTPEGHALGALCVIDRRPRELTAEQAQALRILSHQVVALLQTRRHLAVLQRAEEALREREERFRGTFENAAVGIAHTDLEGRFLRVNEKLCDILGYSREELLTRNVRDVTCPVDWAADRDNSRSLLQGEVPSFSRDKRYLRKDGSPVWVAVSVSLQRDAAGTPLNLIGVVRDITHRKRLETELRQAKEAAEAANRAKDEFLANVSHEIRTPMNAILGMTELALDTELTAEQRQCLKTVKSAADNLLGIINDLLDFAKIEAGKLELDPAAFSLRTAVGDTLRALAVRAHDKGLALTSQVQPDVPDALVGDAGRLRQVLLNLVGNAIKFTDAGEVEVRVRREMGRIGPLGPTSPIDAPPEALLRFEVCDTGIGIARDTQERIFRAFEQEDTSTTRKYGGTGLGLTIAARLVALMGGEITVNSEPGRGSTFAFTVGLGQQAHPPETRAAGEWEQTQTPAPVARPLRILVAEDNEFNAQLLEQLLGRAGHSVRLASNGREALRLADEGHFDLLLLDVHMPELDGFQVVRALRERERTSGSRLPVIALTARSRKEDRERCLAAGMDDFLAKPIQAADLWAAMDRVVHARPAAGRPGSSLLDPRVLLAACGGDGAILQKLCQTFRARLPHHLKAVQDALRSRDAPRLRETAHKLSGMVATFSTAAGGMASELEDLAAEGRLEEARPLVGQLESMADELTQLSSGLSLDALRDPGVRPPPSRRGSLDAPAI